MSKKRNICLMNLAIVTFIFAVLYHGFIFGEKIYAYSDVGSDTVAQYLPVAVFDLQTIFSGGDGLYNLQYGLGKFCGGLITKYLNPANVMILLFGQKNLHLGILAATYVRYIGICVFSFLYFDCLLGDKKAAAVSSLIWTFSGFAVLWGQHYSFLTAMLAFTVAIYGFQLYLQEDKKQYLVVLCMAYLAGTSYYYLYISCFFFLVYGVSYLYFSGRKPGYILRRAGLFALLMIPALAMSACELFPKLADFFASSRMQNVTAKYTSAALFYDIKTIFAFLSRILSNDLLGVGNGFQGPTNYYECAILSTSVLFVFSLVYLLRSKYWKQTLFFTVLSFGLLFMPITSRILSFAVNTQRWSYTLCFAEVIAIGFALSDYLQNRDHVERKHVVSTIVIADVIVLVFCFLFYVFFGPAFNKLTFGIIAATLLAYHLGVLFVWKSGYPIWILVICLVFELICVNYLSVNHRVSPTKDQWDSAMYHDGTEEVVEWIREQDDSLYRIAKTYTSVSSNDPLMQDYYGMGVYLSTNQAELIQLAKSYGYTDAGNWIDFAGSDFLANTMLGVKYVISRSCSEMDRERYELLYDNGEYSVCRNKYWLGFGYLYREQMPESMFLNATKQEKHLLLSKYYYLTNTRAAGELTVEGVQEIDLLPNLSGYVNCEVTVDAGLQIHGTAEDMQLYFDMPHISEGWSVAGVRLEMTTQEPSMAQLFMASPEVSYCEENSSKLRYETTQVNGVLENPVASEVTALRLDPAWYAQDVKITSLQLIVVDDAKLKENLTLLQNNLIINIIQKGNTFTCNASNPYETEVMLCIPLIFSNYWKASVDGVAVEPCNINGGLIGIPLSQGSHRVTLEYQNNIYENGMYISLFSITVYALSVLAINKRRKSGEKK